MASCAVAAEDLISLGLVVLSVSFAWIVDKGRKQVVPRTQRWQTLTIHTCKSQLDSHCNGLGVLTGATTNLIVVDVDAPAAQVFKELEARHGIPPCPRVSTPSGGWKFLVLPRYFAIRWTCTHGESREAVIW